MSKMSSAVKETRKKEITKEQVNFMGGISYGLTSLETMKMVTASSIMGEPQYYRDGEFAQKGVKDGICSLFTSFSEYRVIGDHFDGKKTSEVMEEVIDAALSENFEATIRWALTLRKEYLMRLNPQVIMVRAAMHPDRVKFNEEHPGLFSEINVQVMSRADEPSSQLTYWLYKNGKKNEIPSILKRNWAKRLENGKRYELAKYKNANVGMIDTVRICHANSEIIDELMQTGTIKVDEDDTTWERLRSAGKTWREIWDAKALPHMACLKNLRNIFTEIEDRDLCMKILDYLKGGVHRGKQFPFRYWQAYKMIEKEHDIHHQSLILDALEECIDLACDNMPKLKGKTMCLSDNSGSAWGAFTSEYGSVTIADIDNLSSVITARNSDEGYVGKFGDLLKVVPVSKRNGILNQTQAITHNHYNDVGGGTESGIWKFFERAIDKKEWWDNIFIYSDMQAGTGGLYGTSADMDAYRRRGFAMRDSIHVDVAKLINEYRRKVNPKVNVFSVQTAGYTNVVIPEYGYRTNIMYGWTSKELIYADAMIKLWDEHDEMKLLRGQRRNTSVIDDDLLKSTT